MKVLVTGGTGFLGIHVVAELEKRGHKVDVLPPPDEKSGYDLTDMCDVVAAYSRPMSPDAVIHLAAKCGGIGANMRRPGEFFRDNILMGINMIDVARTCGIKKFVCIGTVCAYPEHTPVPFKETDLWKGYPEPTNGAYGIAKKALLVMLQAYRQQYGFNGIYLMPVNLYGPCDHFSLEDSHVIPAMIRKFDTAKNTNQSTVQLWGTGNASREFLYVKDAARGIVDALEKYNGADPINLGQGQEYTIRDLAETIRTEVGYEGLIKWSVSKLDGQPRRCLDTSRAKELFGFEATTSFSEGLHETYLWWLANRADILMKERGR
jgi:nucleoside-diphosphate-sugar epimerase